MSPLVAIVVSDSVSERHSTVERPGLGTEEMAPSVKHLPFKLEDLCLVPRKSHEKVWCGSDGPAIPSAGEAKMGGTLRFIGQPA